VTHLPPPSSDRERERLLRTLQLGFDLDACAQLVRLYVRNSQPVTAWRLLDDLYQDLGYNDLRDLQRDVVAQVKLSVISRAEYDRAVNDMRSFSSAHGSVELPRSQRKRSIIFYYIWSILDLRARSAPDEIGGVIMMSLRDLHISSDYCHIRRYMLSAHMLGRTPNGATYWANPESPVIVTSPAPGIRATSGAPPR
jgi:hypothetical protein